MNKIEFLTAARSLIEKPENFTTGDWARDAEGNSVDVEDVTATCFCTLGAMRKVAVSKEDWITKCEVESYLYNYASAYGMTTAAFNDVNGHRAVLNMFDAILDKFNKEETLLKGLYEQRS